MQANQFQIFAQMVEQIIRKDWVVGSNKEGVVALARALDATPYLRYGPAFYGRVSKPVADKLITAGFDFPERLLFMEAKEIAAMRGFGRSAMAEIDAYRAKFVPPGLLR